MKLAVNTASTRRRIIECDPEHTLMESLVSAEVAGVDAICGGMAMCGTCLVDISKCDKSHIVVPDDAEKELLASMGVTSLDLRLSCQLMVSDLRDAAEITIATDVASLA